MNQILPLSMKLLFLAIPVLSSIMSIVLASKHYYLQQSLTFPYTISIVLAFFELQFSVAVFVSVTLSESRSRKSKLVGNTCIIVGFLGLLISGVCWLGNLISFSRDIVIGKEKETRALQMAKLIFWSLTAVSSSSYITAIFSQSVTSKAEFGFSGLYQLRDGIKGHNHAPSQLTVNFQDDFPGVPVTELEEFQNKIPCNYNQNDSSKYSPTLYNARLSANTHHDDYHTISDTLNNYQASPRRKTKLKSSNSSFRNSVDTMKVALIPGGSPSSVTAKSRKIHNLSIGSSIDMCNPPELKLFDTHETLSLNCNINGLDIGTSEISPTGTIVTNNSQGYEITDYKHQRNLKRDQLTHSLPFSAHRFPESSAINHTTTAWSVMNGVRPNRKSFGLYESGKRVLSNHFSNPFKNTYTNNGEENKQLMVDYMQPNTLRRASGILDLHYNHDRRESSYGQNILSKLPQSILPSQLRNDSFSSTNTSPKRAKFQNHFSRKSQNRTSSYFDSSDDLMEIPANPNLTDNGPRKTTQTTNHLHNLLNHRKHFISDNDDTLREFSLNPGTRPLDAADANIEIKNKRLEDNELNKSRPEPVSTNNDFDAWEVNSVAAREQLLWSMSNLDTACLTTPQLRNVSGSSVDSDVTNISNSNPLATPEMFLSHDRKSWCNPTVDTTKTILPMNDSNF